MATPNSNHSWPDHPVPRQIQHARTLYGWLTNSLAILILLTCAAALWTKEFRTFGEIRIAGDISEANRAAAENAILSAIKKASTNEALQETLRLVKRSTSPANGYSGSADQIDLDALRSRIRFAVFLNEMENQSSVMVELAGSGTVQERELVRHFLQHVREIIDFELGPDAKLTSSLIASHREAQLRINDALSSVAQLRGQLGLVETALEDHQLALLTPEGREQQLKSELVWLDEELQEEFGASSEERREFQARFASYLDGTVNEASTQSPFQLTGSQIQIDSELRPLGSLKKALLELPVESFREQLTQADRVLAGPLLENTGLAIATETGFIPKLRVTQLSSPTHQPQGALSERGVLLGLLLSSLIVGWALTLGLHPSSYDAGFEKDQSLEQMLKLPVLAEMSPSLAASTADSRQRDYRRAIIRASELVLTGTLLLFIGLFATNAEMREAILSNPLHAFSRVVWSLIH